MTLLPVCLALAVFPSAPPPVAGAAAEEPLPAGALARLGTYRLRHTNRIGAIAFSPDGKLLASAGSEEGGRDHTVRLWAVATGEERRRLEGHQSGVDCLAFAPDGNLLASGGRDRTLRLWDVVTGREVRRLTVPKGGAQCLAFSPDGKTLASVSMNDTAVHLWDVATG
jgi:WD40 repeat protein